MPTARPIIVITLVTKNDSWKNCPSSAVSPMATAMETIASTTGMSAAATAPKTMTSTPSASGMPNASPVWRSVSACLSKSSLTLALPATWTAKPSLPFSPRAIVRTSPTLSIAVVIAGHDEGMIVVRRSSETSEGSLDM